MKKQIIYLLTFFISFIFVSCQTKEKQNTSEVPESHENHAKHAAATVQLNHGERWQANPETTDGVAAMQLLLVDPKMERSAVDIKILKENLNATFQQIFDQCTMTGDAHEQLHNYLIPIKEMFEKINVDMPEKNTEVLVSLNDYLQAYSLYFI